MTRVISDVLFILFECDILKNLSTQETKELICVVPPSPNIPTPSPLLCSYC